jgi:SAM-dependent methyltransferase
MLSIQRLIDEKIVVCPRCHSPVRPDENAWRCTDAGCLYSDVTFPSVSGLPVLVDFEDSVLQAEHVCETGGAQQMNRTRFHRILNRLVHPKNTTAAVQSARMVNELRTSSSKIGRRPRILVVGGGTIGDGLADLYADETVDLVSFDIYLSPDVQFIGDGHGMPLADESMDGVVVQAVLEHVLEPSRVAGEISRVLRTGGIVYADTPFLQHVHEGPYDFTRFTDSGHRYLFRQFELIDSGTIAGAGTTLRWSIDYFVRALTRVPRLGRIAGLAFFWLSLLDRILDPRHSLDGASSIFFLGRKTERSISPAEIIDYYQGGIPSDAQHSRR